MNKLLPAVNISNESSINQKNTSQLLSVVPQLKIRQPKLSGRFQKISEDLDKSFTSHNQGLQKQNHNLSKVQRKDTRESEPEHIEPILRNQQTIKIDKNDPISNMIKKSQNDPFMRRKLMAVMDNDLKSLKRLNDQKGKHTTTSTTNLRLVQSVKLNSTKLNNPIDNEINRLPKDISKILDVTLSRFGNSTLKKNSSQTNILAALSSQNMNVNSLHVKNQQELQIGSPNYTTLRRQSYKKKIQCLQILRDVDDQQARKK